MSETYTTAHSNARSFNPLSEARDGAHTLMGARWLCCCWASTGTPEHFLFLEVKTALGRDFCSLLSMCRLFTGVQRVHLPRGWTEGGGGHLVTGPWLWQWPLGRLGWQVVPLCRAKIWSLAQELLYATCAVKKKKKTKKNKTTQTSRWPLTMLFPM